ncbi:MAG: hypothetical protein ABI629_09450, partial [bacterium]
AWGLGGALLMSLAALLSQLDIRRRGGWFRKLLPAVWQNDLDPLVVTPLRSRAGGTHGRVPLRPAAGSPLLLRPVRRR